MTTCPSASPPSFGGTLRWRRTSNPDSFRPRCVNVSSKALQKTPPDRATTPSPVSSLAARASATTAAATPRWNRAATASALTPSRTSATTARTSAATSSRKGSGAVSSPGAGSRAAGPSIGPSTGPTKGMA